VTLLAQSVAGKGQIVEARGPLLFAHPTSHPRLELPSLHALHVTYGIFKEAWSDGRRTDGVCFRISVVPTGQRAQTLHERCLTPVERVGDRTDQQFETHVDISRPVALVLETDCRRNCSWGWSYWRDIDVTP
jgi:hypothetical protein